MSKYNIFFTKEDAKKAYARIEFIEKETQLILDWQKIKRMGGDAIATLLGILEKQYLAYEIAGQENYHSDNCSGRMENCSTCKVMFDGDLDGDHWCDSADEVEDHDANMGQTVIVKAINPDHTMWKVAQNKTTGLCTLEYLTPVCTSWTVYKMGCFKQIVEAFSNGLVTGAQHVE